MKEMIRRELCLGMVALSGCLAGSLAVAASAGSITVVQDSQPASTIVISSNPTRSAQFAAEELRDQVEHISGAELPIATSPISGTVAIYVGESKAATDAGLANSQFKEQEYAITFLPDSIVLTGLDAPIYTKVNYDPRQPDTWGGLPGFWEEKGSLNAVYDFLARYCGVHYFNPTEYGTSYPQRPTLRISGENVRRRPFFRYREVHPVTAQPARMDSVNILWSQSAPEFSE